MGDVGAPPTASRPRLGPKYNHSNFVTMDRNEVIKCLKGAGGYVTPHLNDKLYLHNNNFRNIAGLEEFVETKVIWLQSNCLVSVDGLSHLKKLRVLYLHQNMIKSLEVCPHNKFARLTALFVCACERGCMRLNVTLECECLLVLVNICQGLQGLDLLHTLNVNQNALCSLKGSS
jgi:Leucine-rich repeat (LRR) protein